MRALRRIALETHVRRSALLFTGGAAERVRRALRNNGIVDRKLLIDPALKSDSTSLMGGTREKRARLERAQGATPLAVRAPVARAALRAGLR